MSALLTLILVLALLPTASGQTVLGASALHPIGMASHAVKTAAHLGAASGAATGGASSLDVGHAHIMPAQSLHGSTTHGANSRPTSGGPLNYHGGPVQHNPTFYAIFWLPSGAHFEPGVVNGDAGYEGLMARYLQDASQTSLAQVAAQYYDNSNGGNDNGGNILPIYQYGGAWTDTTAYPHSGSTSDPLQDGDIQAAVNRALANNPSWQDGTNSTFYVFTGAGIQSCLNSNNCTPGVNTSQGYCAYHSWFTDTAAHTAIYANMPDDETVGINSKFEGCSATGALPNGDIYADAEFTAFSHEQYEAETDPLVNGNPGWYDPSGQEIGDLCLANYGYEPYFGPSNFDVNGHLYVLQQEWSNADGACGGSVSGPNGYLTTYGPYVATAGVATAQLNLALTQFAPSVGVVLTPNPSINWGDGSSQTCNTDPNNHPSCADWGATGCTNCTLHYNHTYASPGTYSVTVTYNTGCCISYSTTLHIFVFAPPKPTSTPTNTPTNTPTSTPTNTPTNTPTATPTTLSVCPSGPPTCQYAHIQDAVNAAIPGDTIAVAAGTYAERVRIPISLIVTGAGAGQAIIDGGQGGTVLAVNAGATVAISGVTIQNGYANGGNGGGIYNAGTLTLSNSTVSGNQAIGQNTTGGQGGGIYNAGTFTLESDTVSGNSVSLSTFCGTGNPYGGGILNVGALSLINSTVANNSAGSCGIGGGLFNNSASATLFLGASTVANNFAAEYAGGLYIFGGSVALIADILAQNTAPNNPDCYGTLTSDGYNVVGIGDGCSGLVNGQNGDQVGTGGSPLNALLGPLQNNGGATPTMALLAGSPAIDHGGTGTRSCPATDQRGVTRPDEAQDNGACDSGAYERISSLSVCPSGPPTCQYARIQDAVNVIGPGGTINVAGGTYAERVSIPASQNFTLAGAGAGQTIVDGQQSGTVFTVNAGATVAISGVTLQNGYAYYNTGGGVYNAGTLTLTNSAVSANTAVQTSYAPGYGGGIDNEGTLTLSGSTVSANSFSAVTCTYGPQFGGGIYNNGTLTLTNSTVADNSADAVCGASYGGGIYNNGTLNLSSSTVSANYAVLGGGLYIYGGSVTLGGNILAGNIASGLPDCYGTLTSDGYNVVGIGDGCSGLVNGQNGDQVGTGGSPLNALLGPLQNNGGATPTMALLAGSPAIDHGGTAGQGCPATDQRGVTRPDEAQDNGACDSGAYEAQDVAGPPPTLAVSPSSGVYQQSLALTGTNFSADEGVTVYLDRSGTPAVATGTTNPSGAFTAAGTVPQATYGQHTLLAVGQISALTATTALTVQASLALAPTSGISGTAVVASGYGFGARETVLLHWKSATGKLLGHGRSNAVGTVAGSGAIHFTVPATRPGLYRVYAVGKSSGAVAVATFKVT